MKDTASLVEWSLTAILVNAACVSVSRRLPPLTVSFHPSPLLFAILHSVLFVFLFS